MEGLHAYTSKAESFGLFKGCSVGRDNLHISHLILVIGIGVSDDEKFYSKLSSWKVRLLSFGGRLTLIREKRMTWVKWDRCLASRKGGGLGIGSIFGLNIGLLFKWIWRFMSNQSDLWIGVIKSIHGNDGGMNSLSNRSHNSSTWRSILNSIQRLKDHGIDLFSFCTRKVGNGHNTSFWFDVWCGNQQLKALFPCIFNLDLDKRCSIANRLVVQDWSSVLRRRPRGGAEFVQLDALTSFIGSFSLSGRRDFWVWSLGGNEGFSVASVRGLVDSILLDNCHDATSWNQYLPIKVNVFVWRLMLNRLPSRVNLDRRNIEVDSLLCSSCLEDIETINHTFFNCGLAKDLWALLAKWWELDVLVCGNFSEYVPMVGALPGTPEQKLKWNMCQCRCPTYNTRAVMVDLFTSFLLTPMQTVTLDDVAKPCTSNVEMVDKVDDIVENRVTRKRKSCLSSSIDVDETFSPVVKQGMFLSQRKYATEILEHAQMVICNPVRLPLILTSTKHIEIDIHFGRVLVATGEVRVHHVPSRYQYANIFTKGLPSALFEEFRSSLSVRCPLAQTTREC
nr:hypothetical protein [Tanacetum cinerariifolium]